VVYKGVIIEESLERKDVLNLVNIVKTKVEQVVDEHKTPWLKQWTMHNVEINEDVIQEIVKEISGSLEAAHPWYADFKNENTHFVIFRNKVFKINRTKAEQYAEAKEYGVSLGIPPYQVDFKPDTKQWER